MIEDLAYRLVKVTESAAVAAYKFVGLGNEKMADQAAVDAMRATLGCMKIDGTITIGEGERDAAPMLYVGEKVGTGTGCKIDIAVDPLEGTTICADCKRGAMSVLAATEEGNFLHAPDVYMEKIAVGKNVTDGMISLKNSIEKNLDNLAQINRCKISDLTVTVLKRDRHNELISRIRKSNAKVKLIDDGDVSAIVSLLNGSSDMYIGIGGAPEGVLAAAALNSIGGYMEGKLILDSKQLKNRAKSLNIDDLERIYRIKDMVKGESVFIATGITDGELVDGIKVSHDDRLLSSSLIILPNKILKIQTKSYCKSML